MMRYLRAALSVLFGLFLILFAIANRQIVAVSFSPLPMVIEAPLYALVMIALAIGAVIGGMAVWFRSYARKREANRLKRRISALEHHIDTHRRQNEELAAAQPGVPGRPLGSTG